MTFASVHKQDSPQSAAHARRAVSNYFFAIVKLCAAALALLSCGTLPQAGKSAEKWVIPEKPVIAESPQFVDPLWQPFAPEAAEALGYYTGKTAQPRLEFHAVRIDLSAPQLRIVVAPGGRNETGGNTPLSIKVSGFVRDNNLLAGINALPFDPVSEKEGEYRANAGIVISDGVFLSPPHPEFDALVFYDDAGPAVIPQAQIVSAINISHAVGGFYRILIDGALSEHTENNAARHPRSAAGISADGTYLYLLVIDGRRPGSVGGTEAETAVILRQLGAWNGINFDGGGSSSLALRFPDGKVRPVNTPVHGGISGLERAVAGCLGVGMAPESQSE
jgi:hypothetical protein